MFRQSDVYSLCSLSRVGLFRLVKNQDYLLNTGLYMALSFA